MRVGCTFEPGYRNLLDPDTGLLVRQTYGADQIQSREWSAVAAGAQLDEGVFGCAGPSRELTAGLAG